MKNPNVEKYYRLQLNQHALLICSNDQIISPWASGLWNFIWLGSHANEIVNKTMHIIPEDRGGKGLRMVV